MNRRGFLKGLVVVPAAAAAGGVALPKQQKRDLGDVYPQRFTSEFGVEDYRMLTVLHGTGGAHLYEYGASGWMSKPEARRFLLGR